MKLRKNWKKAVVVVMTALMLSGNFTMPAMAHGHGSCHTAYVGHHGSQSYSKRTYCSYHHKYHKKKSNCSRYCKTHKTIHKNGKRHH